LGRGLLLIGHSGVKGRSGIRSSRDFDRTPSSRQREMIQAGLGTNYGVLKVVEIEGRLEEVTKIQSGIALLTGCRLGLYGCKAES